MKKSMGILAVAAIGFSSTVMADTWTFNEQDDQVTLKQDKPVVEQMVENDNQTYKLVTFNSDKEWMFEENRKTALLKQDL